MIPSENHKLVQIMFKISVALLALIAGVTATELCGGNRAFVTFREVCYTDNSPREFPGTVEELEDFCTFALGYFECGVNYAKRCDNSDLLNETSNYLRAFQEICNQDTLLHAAIVDNVQCFGELMAEGAPQECRRQHRSPSDETLKKYTEVLIEEGLLALSDDDDKKLHTMACIQMLQEFACYATKIEDKCGIMAVDTFVEVTQKFSTVATCGETYHYLPTVIRVYKLQKEEANQIEEVFKKRK